MKGKIGASAVFVGAIVVLAMFLSYYPHLNYQYPLHVDEWYHIAMAKEVAKTGAYPGFDVYTRMPALAKDQLESAWHYFLAIFALAHFDAAQYMLLVPVLAAAAVLSVYIFARRWGEKTGVIAALFTALIPSNVTMGGTQMLVPINLSLIIVPLALKFAFDAKRRTDYAVFFALAALLLYAHPPSALVLFTVMVPFTLLLFLESRKKGAGVAKARNLALCMAAALALAVPHYIPTLQQMGASSISFPFWVLLDQVPFIYGLIQTALFVAGSYFFTKSGRSEERSIIIAILVMVINTVVFARTGISYLIPYQRTLVPLMMLMSIPAADALVQIGTKISLKHNFKYVVPIVAVIAAAISVSYIIQTSYYHLIDDNDYRNLIWIRDNTQQSAVILADPFQARAVTPIAERQVYTVTPFGPRPDQLALNDNAYSFFISGCTYMQFLKTNHISVVYSPVPCDNPSLQKINDKIYLVK